MPVMPGREGESIFRTVYNLTGCKKPMLRLWISSMEDAAIREGFSALKPGSDYDGLYASALCRSKSRLAGGDQCHPAFQRDCTTAP